MTDRMMYGCGMGRALRRIRSAPGRLAAVQLSGLLALVPATAATAESPPGAPAEAATSPGEAAEAAAAEGRPGSAYLRVSDVRVASAGTGRRLVIDLSRAPERVTEFTLDRPPRLVLDAAGPVAPPGDCLARFPVSDTDVVGVRSARRGKRLRVVVDLHSAEVRPVVHQEGRQLVVQLGDAGTLPAGAVPERGGALAGDVAVDPPPPAEPVAAPAGEPPPSPWPQRTGDPDGFNRANLRFNQWLLRRVLEPVARAYNVVVPKWGQRRVVAFMANLEAPRDAINSALQLKVKRASIHTGRFVVNTTAGLAGFFDVAGRYLRLQANPETLDETLGVWRLPPGTYLILPVIGEFSTRSLVGWIGDGFLNPLSYVPGAPLLAATGAAYVVRSENLLAQGMPSVCASEGEWEAYKQSRFKFEPYEPGRELFYKDQAERVAE
jgi:phospholipid-binding lipoprotein MlaA